MGVLCVLLGLVLALLHATMVAGEANVQKEELMQAFNSKFVFQLTTYSSALRSTKSK